MGCVALAGLEMAYGSREALSSPTDIAGMVERCVSLITIPVDTAQPDVGRDYLQSFAESFLAGLLERVRCVTSSLSYQDHIVSTD